jgi:predicted DNA-binding helix-hairpin-helix protein
MSTEQKIDALAADAAYDVAGPDEGGCSGRRQLARIGAATTVVAGNRPMKLLKVLQTNACTQDCAYCPNRAAHGSRRTALQPDELARTYDAMYRAGSAQGLFLTSGIAGRPAAGMDAMLATAELLRGRYQYRGYLHLKILPGCQRAHVERAMELADRVSINLEAPTEASLRRLSSTKTLANAMERIGWIRDLARERPLRSGFTTQFVVGPGGETDLELLRCVSALYREMGMQRAYFSGFVPVPGTPLEDCSPTPPSRQARLYQADFLLRFYGFTVDELPFDGAGHLPRGVDPKLAVAVAKPERFPVEVNSAAYEELLRVPGVGPLSARRLVARRRERRIAGLRDLQACGVVVRRAAPFVLIDGKPQGNLEAALCLTRAQPEREAIQLSLPFY